MRFWVKAMHDIVLNEDQTRVAAAALRPLQVCDAKGNVVGTFSPIWTAEDVAEAKRHQASNEPRYALSQVLEHLRALKVS
jgi:hypothetical protein